jgi:hypothetical protein
MKVNRLKSTVNIQEQLTAFFYHCTKVENMHIPMQDRQNFIRIVLRQSMLAELRRPAGSTGIDVDQHITEAKERLKKPRPEKADYTPPRPSDWVTAYHVTPEPNRKERRKSVERYRNHNKSIAAAEPRKDWGKGGVKLANLISVAARNRQKLQDEIDYAS